METNTPETDSTLTQKPIAMLMADEVDRFPQTEMKRLERSSKSETPETDAARVSVDTYAGEYMVDVDPRGRWVEATFAEKLERQRDSYAQSLRDIANAEEPIITENVFVRHPELAPKD